MLHAIASISLVLMLCAGCSQPLATPPQRDSRAHPGLDRATVHAELARRRGQQVTRLMAYAQRGEFPHNLAKPTSTHIFRDDAGRLCAVANLAHQDGRDDLVDATVRDHNDLAMADVHDGPILDWILASGLTQEEIVRIQLPAPPLTRRERPLAPAPALVADRGLSEARMNALVVEHIEQVHRELQANTEKSLDLATDRLVTLYATGARPTIALGHSTT